MRVVSSRLAFPPTVVRARTSSSGELSAAMKATASSVPGSVSMMYLVMGRVFRPFRVTRMLWQSSFAGGGGEGVPGLGGGVLGAESELGGELAGVGGPAMADEVESTWAGVALNAQMPGDGGESGPGEVWQGEDAGVHRVGHFAPFYRTLSGHVVGAGRHPVKAGGQASTRSSS